MYSPLYFPFSSSLQYIAAAKIILISFSVKIYLTYLVCMQSIFSTSLHPNLFSNALQYFCHHACVASTYILNGYLDTNISIERGDAKVDLLLSLKGDDKSSNRKKAAKIEGKKLMLLCEKKRVGKSFLPS